MAANVITLEDGWSRLKTGGVKKIEDILEDMKDGVYKDKITTDEYSALYTTKVPPPPVRATSVRFSFELTYKLQTQTKKTRLTLCFI